MTKLLCLSTIIIEFKYLNDILPVFQRIMTTVFQQSFAKCSRITSLQSLFFNFLESNVLLSLGECTICLLVSKTIRINQGFLAFTYQVSPLATDYDVLTRFQASQALSLRFALCAWHLGKGPLSPIIGASRFASFP